MEKELAKKIVKKEFPNAIAKCDGSIWKIYTDTNTVYASNDNEQMAWEDVACTILRSIYR